MKKPSHIRAKKHLSQNFLTDENVINKIIRSFGLMDDDHVVEIGPGYGSMTFPIIEIIESIDVIELDKNLVKHLNENDHKKSVNVIQADALSFDFSSLLKKKPMRLIGNLPYHISTPLLFHLLGFSEIFQDFHIMVQKEVADRMASIHGNKTYGRLSVAIQSRCVVSKILDIKPGAFHPRPKVLSSIVKLVPKASLGTEMHSRLDRIIKIAFNQRRKKVRNSLKEIFSPEVISACGIDPNFRAENLSVEDYIRLSELKG
ncbi:MAG: 16S rRNA (adenine(1518)-N(6)/adenine(1519)-N(6))-dimethyltransferase [Gammaproteobacteria bacterium]|jgi:16S rRNA (adenine1518-N6/adenine1519-N6)-dimethyltransferase|nr:16S rRNA (adenine(1518)-N(6)/adenine(1519)-N(6))-dimethyltransferase [Gammaproteobacteria bacterium]HJL79588.1 16S rRNA (adenine(1518)-N(6)/adenine(1519)-N(6))-dimethyltransferase RsmA [Gammaproteobacteria bacterium]|tara:strand:- start:18340 stop:19116 length:777 start_codon:yes stop_codon:yes gene_type:complete